MRILDALDYDRLAADPKILIGFSDLTVLQTEIWRRLGLVTFSGPMIAGAQFSKLADADLDLYFATLTRDEPPPPLGGDEARVVLAGEAEGPLLGGNLSLLCHLAAAGRLPSLAGAVLLLEDVHEPPYRIDRMLTALRLGGHLDGVAGVAAGEFGPAIEPMLLDSLFVDRLGDLIAPIVAGLPLGHGERNRLIPLGVRVRLTTAPAQVAFFASGVR